MVFRGGLVVAKLPGSLRSRGWWNMRLSAFDRHDQEPRAQQAAQAPVGLEANLERCS